MADKPSLPPRPKPPLPPKPRPPKAPPAAAATRPNKPPAPANGAAARPAAATTAPPFKKPQLAPPPQVFPLKPPPARQYPLPAAGGGGARKPRYRQQHRRGGGGCSCRRLCCLATGLALLALCLALAASCLAYLYYRPRPPSFHLQPLAPVRLRLGGNSSSSAAPAAVSAMDATVGVRAVSWNPNERVAFRYGAGEGRVALADGDGDVALGWAPVAGFEHAPRSVAAVAFVAAAKGVVLDEAVAARVRDRYRRRRQAFKVVVDTHVGVRVGALRTGMLPLRLVCDGGVMAPPGGGAAAAGPMSKCQVYLFRVRWSEVKECRKKGYYNIGFVDPHVVHDNAVRDFPNDITDSLFMALDQYNTCEYILVPYSYQFHWILLVINIDKASVIVFDSLRKPKSDYQDLIDLLNKAWHRFVKKHVGISTGDDGDLYINTEFPCLRQKQGTNLCGYYVCEFIHDFIGPPGQMRRLESKKWDMKEDLIEPARLRAIQESICGFLLDEVINPKGEFYADPNVDLCDLRVFS